MYVINEKYRNSRKIDFNRWSDAAEVNNLVDVLVAGMKAELGIKKLDGYRFNMKTLLMELYHSYLTDHEQYLAYYRRPSEYNFKITLAGKNAKNRYNKNPHITYTCFKGCVDYLASKDYIENIDGGSFRDGEGEVMHSYTARMRATEAFASLWEKFEFNPGMIKRFQPEEAIILKGPVQRIPYTHNGRTRYKKHKPLIPDYKDTPTVRAMRRAVEAYNLLLARTHIDIDVECITQEDRDDLLDRLIHAKDKFKYTINLGAKQVYRVFNNGSFTEGGRFYGAFWIGCPGILRKYITIDGEQTWELDFSGIHINLLYAFKGINFTELHTDAYELIENDPERKLNKLILLTAYNAGTPEETAKAVFKNALDDGIKHRLNLRRHTQVYEKLELLKQKHTDIAEFIAHDYGRELQYHDSCVLEQLINLFTDMEIPILTVHDSIICQARHKDFVKVKMQQFFTEYVNEVFECAIEHNPQHAHACAVSREQEHIQALPVRYRMKAHKITPWNIKAISKHIETAKSYEGRIPVPQNNVIEVSEESTQHRCSRNCNHSRRAATINTGKRVFLGKIRIQTKVIEGVVTLEIVQ